MAREFPTCGFEAFPNGDIRLWIGDAEGANSAPLDNDQLAALMHNLSKVMASRGQWNLTWVVPARKEQT